MPDFHGKTVVIDTLQSNCDRRQSCIWNQHNGKICIAKLTGGCSGPYGMDYELYEGSQRFNPVHICHEVCLRLGKPEPNLLDWPE
jgi:hypothetical protein